MSDLFLRIERQIARISPFFLLSHGVKRVDDRRVIGGIIYVIRQGLQWKDAPKAYGPNKTFYSSVVRWSLLGVFDRIFVALATEGGMAMLLRPKADFVVWLQIVCLSAAVSGA